MGYLKKPNKDISIKISVQERLSLFFNGSLLIFTVYEKGKILRFSYKAVSGRPLNNGKFDYSRNRQKSKREGPIPEGIYYVTPQHVQYSSNRSVIDKVAGVVGRGTMPGGENAWGIGRLWIYPKSVMIDGVVRNNFSIHGSTSAGSAGCIDLTSNDKQFFEQIERYKRNDIKITLKVQYSIK